MPTLRRIRIKNFKSYASDLVVDLPPSAKLLLLKGQNGVGKSSLFDAIAFCLGATPSQIGTSGMDELLNRSNESKPRGSKRKERALECSEIELQFDSGGTTNTILTLFDAKSRKVRINGKQTSLAKLRQFSFGTLGLSTQPSLAAMYIKQSTTASILGSAQATSQYLQDALGLSAARSSEKRLHAAQSKLAVSTQATEQAVTAIRQVLQSSGTKRAARAAVEAASGAASRVIHQASQSLLEIAGKYMDRANTASKIRGDEATTRLADVESLWERLQQGQTEPRAMPADPENILKELDKFIETARLSSSALDRASSFVSAAAVHVNQAQACLQPPESAISVAESSESGSVETSRRDEAAKALRAVVQARQDCVLEAMQALRRVSASVGGVGEGAKSAIEDLPRGTSSLRHSHIKHVQDSIKGDSCRRAVVQTIGQLRQISMLHLGDSDLAVPPAAAEIQACLIAVAEVWTLGSPASTTRTTLGGVSFALRPHLGDPAAAELLMSIRASKHSMHLRQHDSDTLQKAVQAVYGAVCSEFSGGYSGSPTARVHEVCRVSNFEGLDEIELDEIDVSDLSRAAASLASHLQRLFPAHELRQLALLANTYMTPNRLRSVVCQDAAAGATFMSRVGNSERVTAWPMTELQERTRHHAAARSQVVDSVDLAEDPSKFLAAAPGANQAGGFAVNMSVGKACFSMDSGSAEECIKICRGMKVATPDGLQHSHGAVRQIGPPVKDASLLTLERALSKQQLLMLVVLRTIAERRLKRAMMAVAGCSSLSYAASRLEDAMEALEAAQEEQDILFDETSAAQSDVVLQGSTADEDDGGEGTMQAEESLHDCLASLHKVDKGVSKALAYFPRRVAAAAIECVEAGMMHERLSLLTLGPSVSAVKMLSEQVVSAATTAKSDTKKAVEIKTVIEAVIRISADAQTEAGSCAETISACETWTELMQRALRWFSRCPAMPQDPSPIDTLGAQAADALRQSVSSTDQDQDRITKGLAAARAEIYTLMQPIGRAYPVVAVAAASLDHALQFASVCNTVAASLREDKLPSQEPGNASELLQRSNNGVQASLQGVESLAEAEDSRSGRAAELDSKLQQGYRTAQRLLALARGPVTEQLGKASALMQEEGLHGVNESLSSLVPSMVPGHTVAVEAASGVAGDMEPGGFSLTVQRGGQTIASTGLSGGQRSMVACALLLAVNRLHRTPLLLLDEVDAALDATNRARFASILAEHPALEGTQAIVISHHDLVRRVASHSLELNWSGDGPAGGNSVVVGAVSKNDEEKEEEF